jgi:SAM-dependent methyltransferase
VSAGATPLSKADPAYPGQAAYTRRTLRFYDLIAYRIDCPLFWRCSVKQLHALYDHNVSGRHLDVGVGTGYLLDHCRFPVAEPQLTLIDLNPEPLAYAARRLRRYRPETHQANVLAPWGIPAGAFDSVALGNVLNCAPGPMPEKATAFEQARKTLAPGGRVFGATVLNGGVEHTRRSRFFMKRLNKRGVFDNLGDHMGDLEAALAGSFPSYEIAVEGAMAFFVGTAGRDGGSDDGCD